jgi:hypothetical protein
MRKPEKNEARKNKIRKAGKLESRELFLAIKYTDVLCLT